MEWPEDKWSVLLQIVLIGKGCSAYLSLSQDQRKENHEGKRSVLQVYQMTLEHYNKRFQSLQKDEKITFLDSVYKVRQCFKKWIEAANMREMADIVELIVLEQYFQEIYEYSQTYSGSSTGTVPKKNAIVPQQQSSNGSPSGIMKDVQKDNIVCYECVNRGHISMLAAIDGSERTPLKILRNTGCNHSAVIKGVHPFVQQSLTGDSVILKRIGGEEVTPICHLKLSCELVTGHFDVVVKDSLAVERVEVVLGNEVDGAPSVPCPIVTEKPLKYSPTTELEKDYPYLFPSCVMTKNMMK
ncbi:uncharacterized protein [Palaemon carinicauda]|uniref:uncharacterized protein n=1 Tax=Palaemon carinicauda TaxID=392227 RepID=UPI0035B5E580